LSNTRIKKRSHIITRRMFFYHTAKYKKSTPPAVILVNPHMHSINNRRIS